MPSSNPSNTTTTTTNTATATSKTLQHHFPPPLQSNKSPDSSTKPTTPNHRPTAAIATDSTMPDPAPLTNHQNQRASASSSAAPAAVLIDGSEEDAMLSKSEFLTQHEVLKRRFRRIKQLCRMYRENYWELMEELKHKYREYYWEYGKSPFQEEVENNNNNSQNIANNHIKRENGDSNVQENSNGLNGNGNSNRCGVHGCKSKAMALTRFCQMHILSDAKQKLYKACNYAIKSSPTGPILCGKPILRSAVPAYCSLHFQKAEKHVARALKKAGLNVSSTSKLAPKFHVIVAEYVRQIQSKRRIAQKAALENAAIKEEISI